MRGRDGDREYLIELLEWNGNVAFFNYNPKLDAEHKTLTATTTTAAVVVPSTFYFQPVSIVSLLLLLLFFVTVVHFFYCLREFSSAPSFTLHGRACSAHIKVGVCQQGYGKGGGRERHCKGVNVGS